MKHEELDYLKLEKKKDGKDDLEINKEIDFLVDSQIEFKNVKREINRLNQIIKKKDKEIFKLNQKLGEKKQKDFKQRLKELTNQKKEIKGNSRAFLNRILNHLEKDREYSKTDIMKELMMSRERTIECLGILKDLKKIDFRIDNLGVVRYKLI